MPLLERLHEITSRCGPQEWTLAAAIIVLVYFIYTLALRPPE
jgi:hypothetical protein